MAKLDFSKDETISLAEALGLAPTDAPKCPCGGVHPEHDHPTTSGPDWQKMRLRLNVTRKGFGGKTATLVRGLPAKEREALLKELKTHLGVGGSIATDEDDALYLQGDQKERLIAFFTKKGVKDLR